MSAMTSPTTCGLPSAVPSLASGDLRDYDEYNIAWVADTDSRIDTINGFTEVYGDPLGYRGAWESVVSIRDLAATHRISTIGGQAQWFEDHSPIMDEHKKKNVVGISAKVITVVMEGGDSAPSTAIGVNLPNANWIRKEHGSKSVTLGNIMESYEIASAASGLSDEFSYTDEERRRNREFGALDALLHTDMHEVIGHASGQINPGVGTPKETLKTYSSTLEEARSDLVALYFIMDQKLIDLDLVPSLEVGMTSYDGYIRNGLQLQLRRVELGNDIEQAHMRNRQLVAAWVFEKGQPDERAEYEIEDGIPHSRQVGGDRYNQEHCRDRETHHMYGIGVEQRNYQNRSDVVHDRQSREEYLEAGRNSIAEQSEHTESESDIGSHGDSPALCSDTAGIHRQIDQSRYQHAADSGCDG